MPGPAAREFMQALRDGDVAVAKRLLDEGLSPNARLDGAALLHHAAACGPTKLVKLLLDRGAAIDSIDGEVQTPLCWAVRAGRKDNAKLLLDRGADSTVPLLDWSGPRIARSLADGADAVKQRTLARLLRQAARRAERRARD